MGTAARRGSRRRELRAYRAAVAQLGNFNFIQAHAAVAGTRAERPVVALIGTMCSQINKLSSAHDLLESYDIDPEESPWPV